LLNHILTAKHGQRIAVIENEFGAVGIDDGLLKRNMKEHTEDDIIETINGCICCNVRGDLIATLEKLAKRMHGGGGLKLDAVVIETTGMADPSPVAQTFYADEIVQESYRLDGIVTVVDAKHVEQHLAEEKAKGAINETVQQLAFADRIILNKVDLVPDEAALQQIEDRIRTINRFAPLARSQNAEVSVDSVLGIRAFDLKKTLMENPAFLEAGPSVSHDKAVSSVAICGTQDVDLGAMQGWINKLLVEYGERLYRMKGIIAIDGCKERYVYHGVHMLFSGRFAEPWEEGEERCCKAVFIGKDLDHDALRASFNDCLATPENLQKRVKQLRFSPGDAVECQMGDNDWAAGVVADVFQRDDTMDPGEKAPYVVQLLEDESLIFAPADHPDVIRALDPLILERLQKEMEDDEDGWEDEEEAEEGEEEGR
jgi:G3E family GTPase